MHLLDRQNFEAWARFAERDDATVEVVQQAVERDRPVMPREPIRTVMFQVAETLKNDLYDALAKRGHPSDGVEKELRRLRRDAGQ